MGITCGKVYKYCVKPLDYFLKTSVYTGDRRGAYPQAKINSQTYPVSTQYYPQVVLEAIPHRALDKALSNSYPPIHRTNSNNIY